MSGKGKDPKGEETASKNKTQEVLDQVEEVKGIMENNIRNLNKNMDSLEVLQDKTETMKDNSKAFAKGAVQIKRRMWCKNLKLQLLIIGIVLVILIIIIVPIALKFTK